MKILGVHFGHDANAALIVDGKIVADVAEERFNRVKHSADPPVNAVGYCLDTSGLKPSDIDVIAVSGVNTHPDFHKVFKTDGDHTRVPVYHRRYVLGGKTRIHNFDHHHCHAAAGFFLSGKRDDALVMVSDGFGDDCSLSLWKGSGHSLTLLEKFPREGSLGWFYSNVTESLGWIHGDGEGKTMALASYGDPLILREILSDYSPVYKEGRLVRGRDFGEAGKLTMKGSIQWHFKDANAILDLQARGKVYDIAAAAQAILEDQHTSILESWAMKTGLKRICLGGGVFLNIVLNRAIADLDWVESLFIYPSPGDQGLALGAALAALNELRPGEVPEELETIYLGPEYSEQEIETYLRSMKLTFETLDAEDLCRVTAELIAGNRCVGWFQGRMEAGPRALGNRSILMSAAAAENKDHINRSVKFRESFRPFCPSLISEKRSDYLMESEDGPYMILAFNAPLNVHGRIPAVVHHDGSIRPQVLEKSKNPLYHRLISAIHDLTGLGIVLNTSFNVKGEPIVMTPEDAVRCFYSTGMDALVMGRCLLKK